MRNKKVGGGGAGTEALGADSKPCHEGHRETLFDFIRRKNEMEVLISEET